MSVVIDYCMHTQTYNVLIPPSVPDSGLCFRAQVEGARVVPPASVAVVPGNEHADEGRVP